MKGCFNCARKHDCPNEPEDCEDTNWGHWISEQYVQEEIHDAEAPIKGVKEYIDKIDKDMKSKAPKNNEQEDKPQMSLIPDDLLRDFLEPAYREGLIKYSRESWRKGFLATVMMDALKRHLTKWFYEGEEFDPDAEKLGIKKHHLGGALFCLLCLCDMVKNHPELDDRRCKNDKD